MKLIFAKENFAMQQKVIGKRPGNYRLDPYYLRKGIGDKPYFWNDEERKWELLRLGDIIEIDDEGNVTRTPVEKAHEHAVEA